MNILFDPFLNHINTILPAFQFVLNHDLFDRLEMPGSYRLFYFLRILHQGTRDLIVQGASFFDGFLKSNELTELKDIGDEIFLVVVAVSKLSDLLVQVVLIRFEVLLKLSKKFH